MAYCRLEDTARHHIKFNRLASALGIRRAEARGLFLGLCSWATSQAPDGLLVSMTQTDVEHAADWQGKPGRLFPELVNVGLIDVIDANTFEIHDYFERAASRKEAIKKRNQRARPGTRGGTVPGLSPDSSPGRGEERRREEREERTPGDTPVAPYPDVEPKPPPTVATNPAAPAEIASVKDAYTDARQRKGKPLVMLTSRDISILRELVTQHGSVRAEKIVTLWVRDTNDDEVHQKGYPLPWLAVEWRMAQVLNRLAEIEQAEAKRAETKRQLELINARPI